AHGEHVQAIIEITSELPVRHHLRQVATRGRHNANVHARSVCASKTLKFLFLEHPQELGLQLGGDVADLVQEKRAAVREFETSDLSRDGPGERSPLVAEQFALEQSRRNRGAIHPDERLVAAGTSIVDGASDEFLARPCLTQDENRGVSRSHDLDLIERCPEGSAPADHVLEFILRAHFFLEVQWFFVALPMMVGWCLKVMKVGGDACVLRRSALHELQLEMTERVWFGAGESQNAAAGVSDQLRNTSNGL